MNRLLGLIRLEEDKFSEGTGSQQANTLPDRRFGLGWELA